MSARKSIEIPGFGHGGQPIPAASRVGNLVATSGIFGIDRATGKLPDDVGQQCVLMFANLTEILAAAGAGLGDIVKMTFWVKAPQARQAINEQWNIAFPDPASRPARHTLQNDHLPMNMQLQCEAIALITDAR